MMDGLMAWGMTTFVIAVVFGVGYDIWKG